MSIGTVNHAKAFILSAATMIALCSAGLGEEPALPAGATADAYAAIQKFNKEYEKCLTLTVKTDLDAKMEELKGLLDKVKDHVDKTSTEHSTLKIECSDLRDARTAAREKLAVAKAAVQKGIEFSENSPELGKKRARPYDVDELAEKLKEFAGEPIKAATQAVNRIYSLASQQVHLRKDKQAVQKKYDELKAILDKAKEDQKQAVQNVTDKSIDMQKGIEDLANKEKLKNDAEKKFGKKSKEYDAAWKAWLIAKDKDTVAKAQHQKALDDRKKADDKVKDASEDFKVIEDNLKELNKSP
ncbi:MAG: hypothetical protein HZA50_15535 [Planctomycetes bacterium]|nr:hypothetical protein [Planctomycetota bacterium]